jgi:hypothetical protein
VTTLAEELVSLLSSAAAARVFDRVSKSSMVFFKDLGRQDLLLAT